MWRQRDDDTFKAEKTLLEGHKKTIKSLVAAGDYVFSGSKDKSIRVWDCNDLTCK